MCECRLLLLSSSSSLISHFSALAGKYSPILGCSNQQDKAWCSIIIIIIIVIIVIYFN